MAQKGSKGIDLFHLDSPFYLEGSPVIISSGSLVMDRFTEEETIRLCLKNITDTKLVSCELRFTLYDAKGLPYDHELFYKFDGLDIPRGKEFGKRNSIALPDNLVRSFDVSVSEVTFGDYTRWENVKPFEPISPMESLKVAFNSEEMAKQYAVRYGSDCEYMPAATADIWYCTCGAVNHANEARCYSCHRNRSALENVNIRSLKKDSAARVKSEKIVEEAEQREKERKTKQGSMILKICLSVLPVILVATLILATVPPFFERRENYSAAEELLAAGRYEEAEKAFRDLGNYSDSQQRAELDVPYQRAVYVLECARNKDSSALKLLGVSPESVSNENLDMFLYERAKKLLAPFRDFRDTAEYLEEIDEAFAKHDEEIRLAAYDSACALLEKKAYLQARDAFLAMDGYKDSAELARECIYQRACSVLDFCKNNNVRRIYLSISDNQGAETFISMRGSSLANLGSETVAKLKDCFFADGVKIFYEDVPGTSEESYNIDFIPICEATALEFEKVSGYKDSDDLRLFAERAGDFTSEFYQLLGNGDLSEAAVWLNTYDDDVPERGSVSEWADTYAVYRRYWKLYGGDSTIIPHSIGIDDNTKLNEFSSKVCIEGDKAVLCIEQVDGDYVVRLECDAGKTDFSYIDGNGNYYYARINQSGHFIYMWYIENGTMLSSCEYYG